MSSRDQLLRTIALLVLVIALLHIGATIFYLYWMLWWYDLILHFLGGVFIALLVLWLVSFSGYLGASSSLSLRQLFLISLVGTLGVGIGWEIFERLLGHTWSVEGYWLDTGIDLFLDVSGGVVGWFYFVKKYFFHESEQES